MALITNTEQLKEFIPALAGVKEAESNSRFVDFKQDLESANAFIKNELLGATIYGKLSANTEIKNLAIAVEAYKAAISFIPQNDLVLTESGFAVMSTDNQSPASKERIERLINTMKDNLAQSIESLQLAIEDNAELRADWQGVKYCSYMPDFVCKTNRVFSWYALNYSGTSLDYVRLKPQLMQARSYLIKLLGNDFYQDLLTDSTSAANELVINDVQMLFVSAASGDVENTKNYKSMVLAYLIKNIDTYPLFETHYGTPEKWTNSEDNRIVVFGTPRL